MEKFATIDYVIFLIYFIVVSGYGYWIYRRQKSASESSKDYFLAEGSLTWWAIGASLIASNISAEQFIGMSGNGFTVGIAVAAYEWIAAIALIIVAVWFIPVYLKNKIFTMPQFLKQRYNETTALIMAIFWLFLYVFVNLTSILYLGALAISNLGGGENFHIIMLALAVFSVIITLGGMKVIGFTDVIQVVVLIIGGLATTYVALTLVSDHFGLGKDALAGFKQLMVDSPKHFNLIVDKPTEQSTQEEINKYLMLPGIGMYLAGIWIVNLNYWGCNQYITQRALGADLKTARTGILFAGFLKLLMPIIVMLPGIAAYVLYKNGALQEEMAPGGNFNADNAYSAILGFLPNGMKGLSLAALTAAIVASLAGKANSIATIFTMDIYNKYMDKNASEKKLIKVGKITIVVSIIVSLLFTWDDLLGIGGAGGFTFIQKYTGFISPGVFAMFLLGMFWKRTTGSAAIAGLITGFVLSVVFNNYAPAWFGHETFLYTAYPNAQGNYEIPFQICMGLAFLFTMIVMVSISLLGPKINPKGLELDRRMFKLEPSVTVMVVVTILLVGALYVKFW
ncbi:transporter [Sphingobacterium mizutaii NBRC 14946 = DSM 11724]|uniref:Na(+)/glucose symporter n=2 Tax=Sphingobacterium mizutaii TaxID=1010 RepID=A0AAJ5C1X2_9SPHI|nr:sodium/solute symporter [Sphingobacterium mizutaii]GEM66669.1 transporter [Sphingobacterium mizutaii NBRC 14946 = DSM 11724]SDL49048.1 solute:Na+ symporter, SSS family [Sphingobacterium mizutaii]SNV60747.1 Na(+)/glucose symporter [Sphingobacterium mizutaii]